MVCLLACIHVSVHYCVLQLSRGAAQQMFEEYPAARITRLERSMWKEENGDDKKYVGVLRT